MLEDFWLPRREGAKGTEVSTLPGGQNLGEITDVQYFQKETLQGIECTDFKNGIRSRFQSW